MASSAITIGGGIGGAGGAIIIGCPGFGAICGPQTGYGGGGGAGLYAAGGGPAC